MPRRHYFSGTKTEKLTDTAKDFIRLEPVREGYEYHYTLVSVRNRNSNYTRLTLGIERAGKIDHGPSEKSPLASEWYFHDSEIVVTQGCRLVAVLEGITVNDVCDLSYFGYFCKIGGGK